MMRKSNLKRGGAMKNYIFVLIIFSASLFSQNTDTQERINFIPKAGGLNYGEYNVNFRIYQNGGMLTRMVFGVLQGIDIGFSWDIYSLIGTETAHARDPNLYLKFDIFRGNQLLPAISAGYDNQGYGLWNDKQEKYEIPALGFFATFSKELFIPKFYVTAGLNYNKNAFEKNKDFPESLACFAGFNIKPSRLGIFAEALNIGKGWDYSQINAGIVFEFTEGLNFMLAFENVSEADKIRKDVERTFEILYKGAF